MSAVTGRGGGRSGGSPGRGSGQGRTSGREQKNGSTEARKARLPTAAEVAKCTHIEAKHYPKEEYNKFSRAEKQRLWQLMNPDKKPGTDTKRKINAVTSKDKPDDDSDDNASLFPDEPKDKHGGSNRDNSALKRQKK